ncbi:formate/nitrite transporter family protein [Lactiplantibacillus plajomi]
MYSPQEVLPNSIAKGVAKVQLPLLSKLILGFFGGALIALGFLADVRVAGALPASFGGFATILGAGVFPLGLIVILLMGGELVTGNMMVVSLATYDRKIKLRSFLLNLLEISLMNFVGAV